MHLFTVNKIVNFGTNKFTRVPFKKWKRLTKGFCFPLLLGCLNRILLTNEVTFVVFQGTEYHKDFQVEEFCKFLFATYLLKNWNYIWQKNNLPWKATSRCYSSLQNDRKCGNLMGKSVVFCLFLSGQQSAPGFTSMSACRCTSLRIAMLWLGSSLPSKCHLTLIESNSDLTKKNVYKCWPFTYCTAIRRGDQCEVTAWFTWRSDHLYKTSLMLTTRSCLSGPPLTVNSTMWVLTFNLVFNHSFSYRKTPAG